MNITIRREKEEDYFEAEEMTPEAFWDVYRRIRYSDSIEKNIKGKVNWNSCRPISEVGPSRAEGLIEEK